MDQNSEMYYNIIRRNILHMNIKVLENLHVVT